MLYYCRFVRLSRMPGFWDTFACLLGCVMENGEKGGLRVSGSEEEGLKGR